METVKLLAKLTLIDVAEYVKANWATRAYMQSKSTQLGYVEYGSLVAKNMLAFSASFVPAALVPAVAPHAPDLALTSKKVEQGIKIITLAEKLDFHPNSNGNGDDSTAVYTKFKEDISNVIDAVKEMRGEREVGSFDVALNLANDVFDDFISSSKNDLLKTLKTVCTIETKCRKSDGNFDNDYLRHRCGLTLRIFATLVELVRENRREKLVKGSSRYANMSAPMEKMIACLRRQIDLIAKDNNVVNAKEDHAYNLPTYAAAIVTFAKQQGFMAIAEQYEQFATEINNKELSGYIADDIMLLTPEILAAEKTPEVTDEKSAPKFPKYTRA